MFLVPAALMLGVWIVYPTVYTAWRSLYDREGDDFVGLDNYKTLFTTDILVTAIKNNAIWLAVVPALVTAIGLIFGVLTEKISWSVAFKTAVFMPMAISLFAAGVIWRIMDQKEPERGTVNAMIGVVADYVNPPGPLPSAFPATPALTGSVDEGYTLRTPVRPGGTALLPLTGIPPTDVPVGAVQAAQPAPQADGITGVVWRDFKPGGGQTGVVEESELGLPGRHGRAARLVGQAGRLDDVGGRRQLRVREPRGRRLPGRNRRRDLPGAVCGSRLAGTEADHAGGDDRLHLGLGRLRDGRDRRRPGRDPP